MILIVQYIILCDWFLNEAQRDENDLAWKPGTAIVTKCAECLIKQYMQMTKYINYSHSL